MHGWMDFDQYLPSQNHHTVKTWRASLTPESPSAELDFPICKRANKNTNLGVIGRRNEITQVRPAGRPNVKSTLGKHTRLLLSPAAPVLSLSLTAAGISARAETPRFPACPREDVGRPPGGGVGSSRPPFSRAGDGGEPVFALSLVQVMGPLFCLFGDSFLFLFLFFEAFKD